MNSSSRQYFVLIHIIIHCAFYTDYWESHSLKIYFRIKCGVIMYVYRNGRCIKKQAVCDGLDDCGDKTDEKSCPLNQRQDKFCSPLAGCWHWGAESIKKYFYQKQKLRMCDTNIVKNCTCLYCFSSVQLPYLHLCMFPLSARQFFHFLFELNYSVDQSNDTKEDMSVQFRLFKS